MRKKILSLIACLILLFVLCGNTCFAVDQFTDINNLVYQLNGANKTATLIVGINFKDDILQVPELVNGDYRVISIGEASFCESGIKEISLPNSIETIADGAFSGCRLLSKINIPKSLKVLNKNVFENCISLENLYIPNNIEVIEEGVFKRCFANTRLSETIEIESGNEEKKNYKLENKALVRKSDGVVLAKFSSLQDTDYQAKLEDSEKLYNKLNEFLEAHKMCSPEDFEDACRNYLNADDVVLRTLNRKESDQVSRDKLVLYRGLSDKKYAEEFKQGKIYIAKNVNNVRGCGIYTTENTECANFFAGNKDSDVVTMFIDKSIKCLENEYLLDLKDIILTNHRDEFCDYVTKSRNELVFDSRAEYIAKMAKDCTTMEDFDRMREQLRNDPYFQELSKSSKKYFKDKKISLFYNSGVLTKLLGYDALHTDEFDAELGFDIMEYLVVNPDILTICNDSQD